MRSSIGSKIALGLMVAMVGFGIRADTFSWTGAAQDQILTNRLNWVDAAGAVPGLAPSSDDEVIFNLSKSSVLTNYSGKSRSPEFRKIVLRGNNNLRLFFYGNCPTNKAKYVDGESTKDYDYTHALEYVNETQASTLTITGQDPHTAYTTSGVITNFVNVVNTNATIYWTSHLQTWYQSRSCVFKTGAGRFIPWSGHNYAATGKMVTEMGITDFYNGHGMRDWGSCALVFSGNDPSATFNFRFVTQTGSYSGKPASWWQDFVLVQALEEVGVDNHEHTLTSANGAMLVYTNAVAGFTFTGRVRGSLGFTWASMSNEAQTVTFSGGISDTVGTNIVVRGTMALTDGAKFTSLERLIVDSEGTLSVAAGCALYAKSANVRGKELDPGFYKASALGNDGLTGNGAIIVGETKTLDFTVPYVASTKTVTTVDKTAASALTPENLSMFTPIKVALSEGIAYANAQLHATNRLAVATFAAGSGVTAKDFVDVSTKQSGLPVTWFETTTAGNVTTLWLVARPVVNFTDAQATSDKHYLMEEAILWDDGKLPHAGADYYVQHEDLVYDFNSKTCPAPYAFPGDSLTFDNTRFSPYGTNITANLIFWNSESVNSDMFMPYSKDDTTLRGRFYIGPVTKGAVVWKFRTCGEEDAWLRIESTIEVDPSRNFGFGKAWSHTLTNSFELLSNNSGYSNCVHFCGSYLKEESATSETGYAHCWNQIRVTITNQYALGGAMAEKGAAGLRFEAFPMLTAAESMVFDTPNRNWFSADCGMRLNVMAGKTFTLAVPYYCQILHGKTDSAEASSPFEVYIPNRCCLEKSGNGTFALAAPIIPSDATLTRVAVDGTNNLVRIAAGGVMQKAADVFDGIQLEFGDGTRIAVDPTAAFALKTTLVPEFAEGATVDLTVEGGNLPAQDITLDFLHVPASAPDLTSHLRARPFLASGASMAPKLVKTVGDSVTTYSVTYHPVGTSLIIR